MGVTLIRQISEAANAGLASQWDPTRGRSLGCRVGDARLAVLACDPRAWVVLQVESTGLYDSHRACARETVRMPHG